MRPFYVPNLCPECGAIVYGDDDCRVCAARQESEDAAYAEYENARPFAYVIDAYEGFASVRTGGASVKFTKPWARGIDRTLDGFIVVRVDRYGNAYENEHETQKSALDDLFQPYAWPGGYPVIWFDGGDAMCPACARKEYRADADVKARMAAGVYTCDVFEGTSEDHGFIACTNCGAVLIAEEEE